jgi:hypothetical protein
MLQYASFFRASGENTVNRHITVGLAMVASAALGAAAVQTLHAQTKPPRLTEHRTMAQVIAEEAT